MPHVTADSATVYEMHGVTFRSFASTVSGAGDLAAWSAEFAPNSAGVPHRISHEEVVYVLDGELDVDIDGTHMVAGPGDCVLVPSGSVFRIGNGTDWSARAWVTTTLGLTAMIEQTGERLVPPWAQ